VKSNQDVVDYALRRVDALRPFVGQMDAARQVALMTGNTDLSAAWPSRRPCFQDEPSLPVPTATEMLQAEAGIAKLVPETDKRGIEQASEIEAIAEAKASSGS
jgi:hypothetical protein